MASLATINDFPNELIFKVITQLPVAALIAARKVSQRWRELIAVARITPSRRRLLELYKDAIDSPTFLAMRGEIIPHLTDFDREAYVADIESQVGRTLPDDFRTWLLEWPARAVIGLYWPGLPVEYSDEGSPSSAVGRYPLANRSVGKLAFIPIRIGPSGRHAHLRAQFAESADIRDWACFVELHWCLDAGSSYPRTLWYFLAGQGLGEKLVGQVRPEGSLEEIPFDIVDFDAAAKDWIGFLSGELEGYHRC
ncbi:hypothetical protein BKA93DRAFT_367377 [Sparassis latifolia]